MSRLVVGAAVVAGVLLGRPSIGRCAAADAAAPATPAAVRSVEISFAGPDRARAVLEGAIAPLVRGDSRIIWLRSPAGEMDRPPPGVSRLRVDAAGDGIVRIVAFIAQRPPAARSIEAPELNPVTTEVVAQIVGATARAMLAGEAVFTAADGAPPAIGPAPFVPPAGAGPGAPPAGAAPPAAAADASLVAAAAPARARAVAVSAGYLMRSIFDLNTPDPPVAQGVALRVSLFPASSWQTARPFVAFSFEYHQVHVAERSRGNSALDLDYKGGTVHALLGVAGRPLRFLELGAGLGAGVTRSSTGSSDYTQGWFPVGRALVSVAAVGLPTGLELTLAITADAVPDGGHRTVTAAIYPPFVYPTLSWFQPGALLTLGWRG